VVEGADEVKVSLSKGNKEWTAKVVGRDPRTDVAVLKIDEQNLPFVTFADSDKIEVGDVALAIGNPFGVGQTVTMGIVSAIGRGGMGIEDYEDFIQTDAAINPGNSGGALVDTEGRLIGINTAILSRTGGNQGVGFAVPVNLARSVMEQLISHGKVERGLLGVFLQTLTPELAKEFHAPDTGGALVSEVMPGSAAEKAGLQQGDVIVALDGKPVSDSRNLKLAIGRLGPGKKVNLKVLRDGKEKNFAVTLKEDAGQERASANEPNAENSDEILQGVGVTDLTPDVRQQLRIPESVKGAVITEVDPNSAAADKDIKPGDVIQEINRKPIRNAEDAIKATRNVKDKKALVLLWSQGHSRFVTVDESKGSQSDNKVK
jgi:serine protease Do